MSRVYSRQLTERMEVFVRGPDETFNTRDWGLGWFVCVVKYG